MAQNRNQDEAVNGRYVEVWARMYEEEMRYARHHEVLRFHSTTVIVTISAALIAYVATQDPLNPQALWMVGVFLITTNLLGLLISLKHYERNRLHNECSEKFRGIISDITPDAEGKGSIKAIREEAQCCHDKNWRYVRKILLTYFLWLLIHAILILIGVCVLWGACYSSNHSFLSCYLPSQLFDFFKIVQKGS